MAIQYVTQMAKGDILMLDGDISFRKNPYPLFNLIGKDKSLMHQSEGTFKDQKSKIEKAFNKLIKSGNFRSITAETIIYNAGVIGIAEENVFLEKEVLQLTEKLYRAKPSHIIEQLAHSAILAKNTTVIESDNYIFHWWGRGTNVAALLISFFERIKGMTLEGKIESAELFKVEVQKAEFDQKPNLWEKLKKKLRN